MVLCAKEREMDPSLRQVGSSSREERFRVGKVVSYEQEELC